MFSKKDKSGFSRTRINSKVLFVASVLVVLLCHDLTTTESGVKVWHLQNVFKPPPPLVAWEDVCFKAVILLLLIYCLICFPLFVGFLYLSLLCYTLLCVHSGFAIILKRKLVALLLLSCIVTINFLLLFLTVTWVDLQCVIEVFPDHTHLLFVPNSW